MKNEFIKIARQVEARTYSSFDLAQAGDRCCRAVQAFVDVCRKGLQRLLNRFRVLCDITSFACG